MEYRATFKAFHRLSAPDTKLLTRFMLARTVSSGPESLDVADTVPEAGYPVKVRSSVCARMSKGNLKVRRSDYIRTSAAGPPNRPEGEEM